jgi:AhpD family alkylhydroperoxidase
MNCKQCKESVLELLATGSTQIPLEVSDHQQTCRACADFHEAQARLFRSADAGLSAMVNQAVPPSLLPGVWARLRQEPVSGRGRISHWSFAVVTAVAFLAVSVGYVRHRLENHLKSPEVGMVVSLSTSNSLPSAKTSRMPVIASSNQKHRRASSVASPLVASETIPEVIVLPEERQAFARFVAEIPEEQEVALALTQPAPAPEEVPVQIALLQIDSLQLRPLEGTPRE